MQVRVSKGQKRLAMSALPLGTQSIDSQALTRDVEHLGRSLARAARRNANLPAQLRPPLDGLSLAEQVSVLLRAHARFSFRQTDRADGPAIVQRYQAVCRIYGELADAGYRLESVLAFKERHAKVLLERWRSRGNKHTTIRSNWSVLRIWLLALGKGGMLGAIEQYWPDIPKSEERAAKGENLRGRVLDERQMAELMHATDRTHWLVERMRQEVGLTVEEALLFNPVMVTDYLAGRLVLGRTVDGRVREVRVGGQAGVTLVQEVEAFMAERGRRRLMWPDMPLATAVKRHQNRLSYVRRKLPAEASVQGAQMGQAGAVQ